MSLLEKTKSFLTDLFYDRSAPEPEVQQKMEENGWRFEFNCVASAYCAVVVMHVTTPDGEKAFGYNSTEESQKLYKDTLKSTRESLGIKIR